MHAGTVRADVVEGFLAAVSGSEESQLAGCREEGDLLLPGVFCRFFAADCWVGSFSDEHRRNLADDLIPMVRCDWNDVAMWVCYA